MDVRGVHEAWPVLPECVVRNFQRVDVEAAAEVRGVCCNAGIALRHQGVDFGHLPAAHGLQPVSHRPTVAALAPAGNGPLHQAYMQNTASAGFRDQVAVPFSYALNRRFPSSICITGSASKMNS